MPVINILSPHVADLIAAGEVVERPASVVKELIENAVDAGAKNVTVELHGGGAYIRVTDDGCGMAPEDAGVCFLRHATSKLSDARGLEAIGTLGFRGEALAAVSAVSRIELTTRAAGAESGIYMTVEAGDIQEMRPTGCPRGTTMVVRDLFYNTPARLKFMKSDRAESAQSVGVAGRCALGHPEVSLRCIRDGAEVFFTPGDGLLRSAAYAVLGREAAAGLLPCAGEQEGVAVEGFISSPRSGRGSRTQQFFFVNGRPIRSLTAQTALENAYKNTLLVGKFPACVLHINLSCAAVDVNVHPTKAEVKFTDEKKIYDAVYYAALSALAQEQGAQQIKLSPTTKRALELEPEARPYASGRSHGAAAYGRSWGEREYAPPPRYSAPRGGALRDSASSGVSGRVYESLLKQTAPVQTELPLPAEPPRITRETAPAPPEAAWRLIGEAMDTYILVERGEELIFIDKHAAHERILFDRLKAAGLKAMSQTLLEPMVFRPAEETRLALLEHAHRLAELGFEVESFGEAEFILRAIPESIDAPEAISTLEELAADIHSGEDDSLLHTMACKAAIKAGRRTDARELTVLAEKVLSGEIKYCPHGRPVSFALTKRELDKQIKRIV